MRENFLHYLWQYQLFAKQELMSTSGEIIEVQKIGHHNTNSGPDFTQSTIYIGAQLWAGSVEIHLKSSDWYVHNHETDTAYDNVILHVVWDDDMPVLRQNNTAISTLELKGLVPKYVLDNYQNLFQKNTNWIACESMINQVDSFVWDNWKERLYVERLSEKSVFVDKLLADSVNDWDAVLFRLIAKNFGLKVNADSFEDMANSIDFSIVRKERDTTIRLEALFMGQLGMLDESIDDHYYQELQNIYSYQRHKYKLIPNQNKASFFRLRPPNFPTIRISQLAHLYSTKNNIFSEIVSLTDAKDIYKLLQTKTSLYWETNYVFGKETKKSIKNSTKSFLDLLMINTIIPIQFAYQKYTGKQDVELLFKLIRQIKSEKNAIIQKFVRLGVTANSAMDSQALLRLKNNYCKPQSCLSCAIGLQIIKGKTDSL